MCLTELEQGLKSIKDTFQKYSVKTGDSKTLSKKEFKMLMETELPSFTKKDPAIIDRTMENLDLNNEAQLDFYTFVNLVARVLISVDD